MCSFSYLLVDEDFPQADKVTLVMNNLNTHSPAFLYEAFPPEEAKRICDRLEIHYTPKTRQLTEYGGDRIRQDR